MLFNYFATSHALEEQLRSRVRDDIIDVTPVGDENVRQTVLREITERTVQPFFHGTYFYASDASGQKIAGNLDFVPLKPGWQQIVDEALPNAKTVRGHDIWGEGKLLADGTFVFVGQDIYRLHMAEHTIILSYLGSAAVAGILALVAGVMLSRTFLGRIDAINATSIAIIKGDLKERIPTRGSADEIDRLSSNLNRLFDSNQALLDLLRQVTVNIAHDLRTPLSRLRNLLELTHQEARLTKSVQRNLELALSESDQLLSTFSALLRIAQIEFGSRKKAFARVNLSELGERVANIYQAVAEDEGKTLEADIAPNVFCSGDLELLLQLCVNLIENAIRHTPRGTSITLTIASPARLEVTDKGPGIPEDQRQKVLERFFRLDRSRSTPGNGLGLALVAAIANLHSSTIELGDNHPGLKAIVSLKT